MSNNHQSVHHHFPNTSGNVFSVFVLLLFITCISYSCKSGKIPTQGIKGQVFWVEGNQMPQQNETGVNLSTKPKGVKRTIRIHPLTHLDEANLGDTLFGDIKTELVAELETDDSGNFSLELEPGHYSIFTIEENGHFANVFDRDNNINPVEIRPGKWSEMKIIVNYGAYY